jgi:uncharacterized membrane protein YfcA
VGGLVNGAAGGGTLVSFPALLAVGVPALTANMTSTVGIWPGYLGGAAGFRSQVRMQTRRVAELSAPAVAGGIAGSVLLFVTPAREFSTLVPYLVLAACALFALQPLVARAVRARSESGDPSPGPLRRLAAHTGTLAASVYGGYFGAGLGVVFLAILGSALPDELARTNGLRAVLSLVVNSVAVLVFVAHGEIDWSAAALLALTSLVGGYVGARFALRLPPVAFRALVLALGLATAIRLLVG